MENKDVVQSYIWTMAKYDASIHEKKILYRIIESIQADIEGKKLQGCVIDKNLMGDREFTIQLGDMVEGGADYGRLKTALTKLSKNVVWFESNEDGGGEDGYNFVERPKVRYKGYIQFRVPEAIYSAMLDFTKGYRKFELLTAMNFKSEYTMRFYELLSEQRTPIRYNIEKLRELFSPNKYARVPDFIKRVVEPARRELDEKSPFSFRYDFEKEGKAYKTIILYPIARTENRDPELERQALSKKIALSWDLNRHEIYELESMGFTKQELKNNRETFKQAKRLLPDFIYTLTELKGRLHEKENPKGYVIASLRGKIEDEKKKIING